MLVDVGLIRRQINPMNTTQLNDCATAALENYEFSCSWSKAYVAAYDYAKENGWSASRTALGAAVNIAKARWEGLVINAKNA